MKKDNMNSTLIWKLIECCQKQPNTPELLKGICDKLEVVCKWLQTPMVCIEGTNKWISTNNVFGRKNFTIQNIRTKTKNRYKKILAQFQQVANLKYLTSVNEKRGKSLSFLGQFSFEKTLHRQALKKMEHKKNGQV
jgi:hypothetical protein